MQSAVYKAVSGSVSHFSLLSQSLFPFSSPSVPFNKIYLFAIHCNMVRSGALFVFIFALAIALVAATDIATTNHTTSSLEVSPPTKAGPVVSPPPPSPHQCSLTATLAFHPRASISLANFLSSLSSCVELKVDDKPVCKASSEMQIPGIHSTTAQKICAAGGLSLQLLQINAPATIIGATAITAFLEVSTHF
jgi:hypothetical protein